MFNSKTKSFYYYNFNKEKYNLIEKIKSYFKIPKVGLVIVFDNQNYNNKFYPAWRVLAQYIDIEYGGIEELSPKHLLNLMESNKYSFLIWLSQKTCSEKDINFSWIFAHELTHLNQSILNPELLRINTFLNIALRNIDIDVDEPKVSFIIPTELDAELNAWRVICKIFNNKEIDDYFYEKLKPENMPKSYSYLLKFNPNYPYDVISSTKDFLQKYKIEFNKFKNSSNDYFIKHFDIEKSMHFLNSLDISP